MACLYACHDIRYCWIYKSFQMEQIVVLQYSDLLPGESVYSFELDLLVVCRWKLQPKGIVIFVCFARRPDGLPDSADSNVEQISPSITFFGNRDSAFAQSFPDMAVGSWSD